MPYYRTDPSYGRHMTRTVPSVPPYHACTMSHNTGRTRMVTVHCTVVPVYGYGDQPYQCHQTAPCYCYLEAIRTKVPTQRYPRVTSFSWYNHVPCVGSCEVLLQHGYFWVSFDVSACSFCAVLNRNGYSLSIWQYCSVHQSQHLFSLVIFRNMRWQQDHYMARPGANSVNTRSYRFRICTPCIISRLSHPFQVIP